MQMPFEGGSAQGITFGPLYYVMCNILNSLSMFLFLVSSLVAYMSAEVIDIYGSLWEAMAKCLSI